VDVKRRFLAALGMTALREEWRGGRAAALLLPSPSEAA
jgi:hypothetical protein